MIVIVFLDAAHAEELNRHSARLLAEEFGFETPHLYSSEYLVE
jgi:hypothetical protein